MGENVKRLRRDAGFGHQGRFARRAGVSQQWLSDLENDRYDMPDTVSLMKLAVAIGCSVDDLLDGVEQRYTEAMTALRAKRQPVTVDADEGARVVLELEHRITGHEELLSDVRRAAGDLVARVVGDENFAEVIELWRALDSRARAVAVEMMRGFLETQGSGGGGPVPASSRTSPRPRAGARAR